MSPIKVIIIGAGPAGLSAGHNLVKAGAHVKIFEADEQVGGMCKTINLWGNLVDLGPHRFFSKERAVNELWLEIVKKDFVTINRKTRIFYRGQFFDYPLAFRDILCKFRWFELISIGVSYLASQLSLKKSDRNLEDWLCKKFGKKLYQIFFKDYNKKLWGLEPSQLDATFAKQRIKKLSTLVILKSFVFQKIKNKHHSTIDRFAYPVGGTGLLYDKMNREIVDRGGEVLMDNPIRKILLDENKIIGVEDYQGKKYYADFVISTMPLNLLLKSFEAAPAIIQLSEKLKFRNTILVYLEVNNTDLFPDQWIYIQSSDVKCGRVTNFRNWDPSNRADDENSILCFEYWCNDEDELWREKDSYLLDLAKRDFTEISLSKATISERFKVVRVNKCYPVYYQDYKMDVDQIKKYLSQYNNLFVIGRYGSYKYNNQDHSLLMGIKASQKILEDPSIDLWDIRSEEVYDESAIEDLVTSGE